MNCIWINKYDRHSFNVVYKTECNNEFGTNFGDYKKNGYIYCPYCGKEIKEHKEKDHEIW